jgi:hypothetical protein
MPANSAPSARETGRISMTVVGVVVGAVVVIADSSFGATSYHGSTVQFKMETEKRRPK